MEYHSAELLTSAANQSQWPESDLPEVIFAGRSNAGKSTLINGLTNRKNLAFSGKTPGKTVLLNFFTVDNKVVFTDSPGYGFAKGGDRQALNFAELIDPYFADRQQLKCLVLVLDIRREPNEDDLAMIEYAKENHIAILVACMKSDKLSRSQQLVSLRKIQNILGVGPSSTIACSGVSKVGMDQIWTEIDRITGD